MLSDLVEVMDGLKETSEIYAAQLDSDGDWNPMLVIVTGKEAALVGFEMPEHDWQREQLFMTILPNLIHERFPSPDAVVMIVSTWYLNDWDGETRPRDSPDRKEALFMQGISQNKELSYMADIIRSESHPELEWITEVESGVMGGRLIAGLRRAVWT